MSHEAIEQRLAQRIGLDPATVGRGLITRALHARMSALGMARAEDYLRALDASEDELQALIEEVVIPESWFFRDDCPFALFQDHVRAGWLGNPSRPPLRVLSVPCAAGEEPYSIALALLDLDLPPARFSIDAVDVSAQALERAKRGVYSANAFRGTDLLFRARHFREHASGFELDPSVRALVRFIRGNLIDPDLLKGEPPYDVILCRNLLIYLDEPSRRRALDTIDRLLAHPGLLFVGHAERLATGETRFESAGRKGCFAYQRVGEKIKGPGATATTVRVRSKPPARTELPREPATRSPQAAPANSQTSSPAPLLEQAAALADEGRNDQAAALCERALREAGPNPRTLFLLGMIRQSQGDLTRAEETLRKVVYLDPRHDEALLALSLIAQRRGDRTAADGFRRRAERAHKHHEKGTP
ncbi:MAG: CheR family methyltransferase [Isosphaeraceae bacterium]|nr:CheR family methyltransferase [Isosphaeraceae bacterium]